MNENTAELAVHIAASGQNADAAQLCDSVTFMKTVTSLDPDKPGFVERVSGAVRNAVGANPAYRRSDPQPPPPPPVVVLSQRLPPRSPHR